MRVLSLLAVATALVSAAPKFDGPFGRAPRFQEVQARAEIGLGLRSLTKGVSVTPTKAGALNEVKINGLGTGPLTASTESDGSIILSDSTGNRIKINVNVFAPSTKGEPVQTPVASSFAQRSSYGEPEHSQISQGVPPGHLLLPRPTLGPDEQDDSTDGEFYDQQKAYDLVDGLNDGMAIDIQTLAYAKKTDLLAQRRKTHVDNEISKICKGSLCPSSVAFTTN